MEIDIIIDRIFRAIEDVTGVSRELIVSKSRDRDCHFARMIAVHHLRAFGFMHVTISAIINRRSESNAIYLLKAYTKERTPYFRARAEKAGKILSDEIL